MPEIKSVAPPSEHDNYIFCVGRPDHASQSIELIHKLGYKAGIFADSQRSFGNQLDNYDAIVPVNFTGLTNTIEQLAGWYGRIAGLICTYENYIVSKAQLGEYFNVPALSIEAASAATNKLAMRAAFANHCPQLTPAFRRVATAEDAVQFANKYGYPVIVKPTDLVKSLLVTRCNSEDELRSTITHTMASLPAIYKKYGVFNRTPQIIVEEFVTGPMYSIAGFVNSKGNLQLCPGATSLISAQAIGKDDNYLFSRTLPANIEDSTYAALVAATKLGVSAMKLTSCPIHAELIIGKNGIKIVEIGARIGGYRPRMYALSYDIDLIELDIQNALDTLVVTSSTKSAHKITSTYELFADREGQFVQFNGPIDEVKNSVYFSQKLQPGNMTGRAADGHKAGAVVIQTESTEQATMQSAELVKQLEIEVSH